MRLNTLRAGGAIAAAVLMYATGAQANSMLELISGGNTQVVNGAAGQASYIGSIGGWTVNVTTGLAAPFDGGSGYSLDVNSTDFTAPGTAVPLKILWEADPYTSTGTYEASIGGTLGTGTTLSFATFYGSLATPIPLTAALNFSVSPFSGLNYGTIPASAGTPFGLIEQVTLSGGHAGSVTSFDANLDLTSVPDGGATMILLGGAITALGLFRLKAGSKNS